MRINKAGLDLVKRFEGLYLKGYVCPAGVLTIGYGHTGYVDGRPITTNMYITAEKAEELLMNDMARFEKVVAAYDYKYLWTENEFSALVSFAFNVGNIHQLTANGTRTKKEIADKMLLYNKGAGKVMPGLTRRRQAERELFLTPDKKTGDDEMVEQSKIIVNGKEIAVKRILKDGTNYIKIRDIADALGYTIGNNGSIPVLVKK